MKLKLVDRETHDYFYVDCDRFNINEGNIICHKVDNYSGCEYDCVYSVEDYSCELVPKFMTKVRTKWKELTAPCPDEALLEDAVKYLSDVLCIIEAIPDDGSREEYLRYLFKHNPKWEKEDIDELIHIAM